MCKEVYGEQQQDESKISPEMIKEGKKVRRRYKTQTKTCCQVGTLLKTRESQVACLLELHEGEDILDLV